MTKDNKEIFKQVLLRLLVEFVPPIALSALWAYYNATPGRLAESGVFFSAAFIFIGTMWLGLLRIHHQVSTRVHQEKMAGGMQDVDTQIKDIGTEISAVKSTLDILTAKIDAMGPRISDTDVIEVSNLVRAANNHIETANTKFDALRGYSMKAEPAKFRLTLPSE